MDRRRAGLRVAGRAARQVRPHHSLVRYPGRTRHRIRGAERNAGHGSFGGEDAGYTAVEVASAIERWGTPVAGLETCPQFLEALERHTRHVNAKGTHLEILRAKYLLDAMRARVAIAQAEDEPPFAGYAQHQPPDDMDDAKTTTLVLPWEAAYDC